jgi:hypothetical protein
MAGDQTFSYSQARVLGDDEIRLIRLLPWDDSDPMVKCEIVVRQFDNKPQYEALSYTWGRGEENIDILLDGKVHQVQENLWLALRRLRLRTGVRFLWVDAICIDQANEDEKSRQVRHMGTIYKKATGGVVVWLGAGTEESHIAISCIKRLFNGDISGLLEEYYRPQAKLWTLETLDHLCCRPYWSRLWIIQEVVHASKIMVYCGEDEMDWLVLSSVWRKLKDKIDEGLGVPYPLEKFVESPIGQLVQLRNKFQESETQTRPLVDLFTTFHDAKCDQDIDKIFGFHSLADPCCRKSVPVDYSKSTDEICRMAIYHHFLRHGVLSCDRMDLCRKVFGIVLGDKPALRSEETRFLESNSEIIEVTGSIQGKILYLSPTLDILACGDSSNLGRAPRLPRQLNRKLHNLLRSSIFLKLSSDISVVQHLRDRNSYADRHRLPYKGGDRCELVTSLEQLSPNEILQSIWFFMIQGQNSAMCPWLPHETRLFIEENGMIGFAPSKSKRRDLVCRFKKKIFDAEIVPIVRESRSGKKPVIGMGVYYTDSITPCSVFYSDEEDFSIDEEGLCSDQGDSDDGKESVDEDITISLHKYICRSDIRFHLTTETLQILSHTTDTVAANQEIDSSVCYMDVD